MNTRENILRAVHFDKPDHIPVTFHINEACWEHYPRQALQDLMAEHTLLFPDFTDSPGRAELDVSIPERIGKPFTDGWGCVWETVMDGIVGTVTKHPLASWDSLAEFTAPDPEVDSGKGAVNWQALHQDMDHTIAQGQLGMGGLRHGHTFQTLVDIRGYENLLFDMADNEPRLGTLIDMVEAFNMSVVQHYLDMDVEWMGYPEDLGMQNGPMLSPEQFREYIKPSYERLMAPARAKDLVIHMHSDGHIHDLIDDLISGGVNVLNLQDLVNGIDWIKEHLKDRICIDLDIDRQFITVQGTPQQIDDLIREEVETLGSRQGGLMVIYGLYPGVPLENVKALMDAMEKYAFFFSD